MPTVRKRLEQQIGPVDERDWQLVVDEQKDWQTREGLLSFDELADFVRRLRDLRRPRPRADGEVTPRTISLAARSQARSALATFDLNNRSDVQLFRARELGGKLLAPDQVVHWIVESFERERPSYWPYRHPVTGEQVSTPRSYTEEQDWPPEVTLEVYVLVDDEYRPGNFAVPQYSQLARLAALAAKAAELWDLRAGEVAESILTGRQVWAPSVVSSAVFRPTNPTASTITMKVDPYATPAQVAAIWADLRSQMFRKVPRQQSDKHLGLASLRMQYPDMAGPELRRRWNRAHPAEGERYDNHRHFMRDVKLAVGRFTQPEEAPWIE